MWSTNMCTRFACKITTFLEYMQIFWHFFAILLTPLNIIVLCQQRGVSKIALPPFLP